MERQRAKIIGIARHRLSTDGDGVTTLVAFHGCPLCCRYCLSPQTGHYEWQEGQRLSDTSNNI